jgi:hypothetical protein
MSAKCRRFRTLAGIPAFFFFPGALSGAALI